jgi:hypothetical protein
MPGLDDHELAQHSAEPLPVREQMSLMSTGGGLGSGLVDVGATDTTGGGDTLTGSTDAQGSTDPSASTSVGNGYTEATHEYTSDAQEDLAAAAPSDNDGEYSPSESATASSD